MSTSPLQNSISSSIDYDEIEYSRARPRATNPRTEVLGVRLTTGDFKIPPRSYTSRFSLTSEASTLSPASSRDFSLSSSLAVTTGSEEETSPAKAQKVRLDRQKMKGLLVKLKIGNFISNISDIEERSDTWRAEMIASGARYGKTG